MELPLVAAAAVTVLVGLAVEQRFFARGRVARRGEAIAWGIGWLVLALLIAVAIAIADGHAGAWATVYLIERSLSLDNVFLFSLLLAYFAVPRELRSRVVAIGIVGALVLRGLAMSPAWRSSRRSSRLCTPSVRCSCTWRTAPCAASPMRPTPPKTLCSDSSGV